eukprot:9498784-Pyramimonas_sp.AAC.1
MCSTRVDAAGRLAHSRASHFRRCRPARVALVAPVAPVPSHPRLPLILLTSFILPGGRAGGIFRNGQDSTGGPGQRGEQRARIGKGVGLPGIHRLHCAPQREGAHLV